MVRYADDFVMLCRSQGEAAAVLEQVRQWTEQAGLAAASDENTDCGCHSEGGL